MKLKTNKKTICIAVPLYFPHPGGYESFVRRLSEELCIKGYRIIILTCALSKDSPKIEQEESGAEVVRLDSYLLLGGRFPIDKNNHNNKNLFCWLKNQNINYFIINTRFYKLSSRAAKFATSLNITPILIDHGSAHLVLGNKILDPIVARVEHYLTNRLKRYNIDYYGISQASVKWLKHFKINAKGVIPNSINSKEFAMNASSRNIYKELLISKKSFIVFFIGRYTIEKGVLSLLESAKKLKNDKNIHFVLCGKGKYKYLINQSTNKCNIHDLGIVSTEDVSAIMKQSSVMCLPSRSEGFCTSLLEASSCKLPSIITHVGGVDELIPDKSYGYILNDSNPDSISKAIKYMKNNKHLLSQMGEKTYMKVNTEYNWSTTTEKIIKACKLSNCN